MAKSVNNHGGTVLFSTSPANKEPCQAKVKAPPMVEEGKEEKPIKYKLTRDEMKKLDANVAPVPEVGIFSEESKEALVDFVCLHIDETIEKIFDPDTLYDSVYLLVDAAYDACNGNVSIVTATPILTALLLTVVQFTGVKGGKLTSLSQLILIMEVFKGMILIAFSGKVPKSLMEELGYVYIPVTNWVFGVVAPSKRNNLEDPVSSLNESFAEFTLESKSLKRRNSKVRGRKLQDENNKVKSKGKGRGKKKEEDDDDVENSDDEESEDKKSKKDKRDASRVRRVKAMKQRREEKQDQKKCCGH